MPTVDCLDEFVFVEDVCCVGEFDCVEDCVCCVWGPKSKLEPGVNVC